MTFTPTIFKGCYTIHPEPFSDDRGWFARYYCRNEFEKIGHTSDWVQMNHSFTEKKGTLRGMHFQFAPHAEIKMVKCIAGAVYDVVIDLRRDSPTFLSWLGVELSAANRTMIYIPQGFAHGFQTLADNTELLYHHSAFYTAAAEGGLRFDDPRIAVTWPLAAGKISERDSQHPYIDENFKGI